MKNICHNFFTDFVIFSSLWYQFKALGEKHSLATRLEIYKNKSIYHRNVSLSKIKLLDIQKSYFNKRRRLRRQVKKRFFNFFFYGKPQVGFNQNQFWTLGTCRITTVKSVFVLLKIKPKHRSTGVCGSSNENEIF